MDGVEPIGSGEGTRNLFWHERPVAIGIRKTVMGFRDERVDPRAACRPMRARGKHAHRRDTEHPICREVIFWCSERRSCTRNSQVLRPQLGRSGPVSWLKRLITRAPSAPVTKRSDEAESASELLSESILARDTFAADALVRDFPLSLSHKNKELLFRRALAGEHSGEIDVSRFEEFGLPRQCTRYEPEMTLDCVGGYFDYETASPSEWHLNFADSNLFGSYGAFPFAQDEIQVAEHPVLGCLREALLARPDGLKPLTVEFGQPTPVLIRGVQRRISLDTTTIYGRRFGAASADEVLEAVTAVAPTTLSNILAIEAPVPEGQGCYSHTEINQALSTAFSGFRAAALNSWSTDPDEPVVIHTGFWGCGAYGGNIQLMSTLQILAGHLSGVDRLVFHTGATSPDLVRGFAGDLVKKFGYRAGESLSSVVSKMARQRFPWGTPDGN